jgi:predicted Rossmann-fold nucleotide-binding protein
VKYAQAFIMGMPGGFGTLDGRLFEAMTLVRYQPLPAYRYGLGLLEWPGVRVD